MFSKFCKNKRSKNHIFGVTYYMSFEFVFFFLRIFTRFYIVYGIIKYQIICYIRNNILYQFSYHMKVCGGGGGGGVSEIKFITF